MARQRLLLALAAAIALVGVVVAVTRNDGGGSTLSTGAGDATTQPTLDTTTTSETTTATSTTTSVPAGTSTTRRVVLPTAAATTAAPKALVLNSIRIGIGAPCRDASTTTTNGGASEHDIDGCWFFAFWPLTERDVNVVLHSDKGFDGDLIGPPCQENDGQCHAYIGPVYDRAVDERECFWLTTADAGWTTKSNSVCANWRARP